MKSSFFLKRNRVRKQIQKQTPKPEAITVKVDALDDSSSHNGRLLVSFLLFQAYLLITIAAVTDYTLLMPESTVKLPLLDVEMPLFGFFIVAPLILVIIHFNILLHLLQHARILHAYKPMLECNADEQLKLPPFLLNFGLLFKPATVNYALVRILFFTIFYIMPLSLLVFVQWTFADYHSLGMTIWHLGLVWLDLFVIFMYWTRIVFPEQLLGTENDRWKELLRSYKLLRRTNKRSLWYLFANRFVLLLTSAILAIVVLIKNDVFLEFTRTYEEDTSGVKARSGFVWNLIPHISATEKTLVKSPPGDVILATYLQQGWDLDSAWLRFATGLSLQGRDLRLANLYKSNLLKSDLRGAVLDGASLIAAKLNEAVVSNARLNGAILYQAQLNGANLSSAWLNNAVLFEAQLNGATLTEAQLNGATLIGAQLNGATLTGAQLNGANLTGAQLNSADLGQVWLKRDTNLSGPRLNGANLSVGQISGALFGLLPWTRDHDLSGARLNGANLSMAQLNGARVSGVQLNGADLSGAQLNGAHLLYAQLNGAQLRWAQLNGAHLFSAQLNGANLNGAQLNGAILESTKVRGSIFNPLAYKGVYFATGVDTSTSVDWLKLKRDSLFVHQKNRDNYIRRILDAEKRDAAGYVAPLLKTFSPDITKFLEERNQLACENSYAAEGMILEFERDIDKDIQEWKRSLYRGVYRGMFGEMLPPTTSNYCSVIVEHMLKSCPDSLAVIEQRNAEVKKIVDEFRQANKK